MDKLRALVIGIDGASWNTLKPIIESCKYLAIDTEILLKALGKEISLNNWRIVKGELKKKYGFN